MIDVRKNAREVSRVRKREFKGRHYIDARTFYPGEDGELRPSGKGVAMSTGFGMTRCIRPGRSRAS